MEFLQFYLSPFGLGLLCSVIWSNLHLPISLPQADCLGACHNCGTVVDFLHHARFLFFTCGRPVLKVVPVVKEFARKSYISQKSAVELKQDLLQFCIERTTGYEVHVPWYQLVLLSSANLGFMPINLSRLILCDTIKLFVSQFAVLCGVCSGSNGYKFRLSLLLEICKPTLLLYCFVWRFLSLGILSQLIAICCHQDRSPACIPTHQFA